MIRFAGSNIRRPRARRARRGGARDRDRHVGHGHALDLTYEHKGTDYSKFHVTIERDGKKLFDHAGALGLQVRALRRACPPTARPGKDSVAVEDVNGDREPDVIVDLFTGGAHCCEVSAVYSFVEGSGTYSVRRHDWADAGYRLRDLGKDGQFEFYSADARFAYRYASYAESYLPVRIFRLRQGQARGRDHVVPRRAPRRRPRARCASTASSANRARRERARRAGRLRGRPLPARASAGRPARRSSVR